ncbi:hypothetical protein EVAR_66603_1 [Eumeta japonica]|uniref:Uncharacterized protein n=1 Tax=Eumeta variegata TaxID=151549 RepID=A0A4C1T8Y5_EUMVA|nr:hypothetical protein EVAR_66603_1 [Eumeta japonica]
MKRRRRTARERPRRGGSRKNFDSGNEWKFPRKHPPAREAPRGARTIISFWNQRSCGRGAGGERARSALRAPCVCKRLGKRARLRRAIDVQKTSYRVPPVAGSCCSSSRTSSDPSKMSRVTLIPLSDRDGDYC